MRYRVVQPFGHDIDREATTVSEHPTVDDAFAEIDRLTGEVDSTRGRRDGERLIVVDEHGEIVPRPGTF